jgi:hypothetical protein
MGKILYFVDTLKATIEKSMIRICNPVERNRGPGAVSKRHGSGILVKKHLELLCL